MDKGGRSSRLISTLMQPTGGNGDVFLDKSSKKEKLRRLSSMDLLGEMNQLSHPLATNSATKRVKVAKKFSHRCGAINLVSAPTRKLRSAMKKRENEVGELPKDCTKKHKAIEISNPSEALPSLGFQQEFKDSKMSSVVTKDEEEVAEALFVLAQTALNITPQIEVKPPSPTALNTTLQMEVKPPPSSLLVEETMPPNGKKSRNRCSVHVYICSFIKLLQTKTHKVSNQEISDIIPQTITNNDYDRPKITTETMASQVLTNPGFSSQQVVPYSDTMDQHHAQPSTQNLTSTGCYQNWQSQRHDRTGPVSGSKYTQGSLLQALGSNIEQQRRCISMSLLAADKGKMKLSDCSSGYDEKRGLFFVDGPMLKLTL